MKKLMLVALVLVSGCAGLEKQRVKEEAAALVEWQKAIPLILTHPGVSEDEKKSWVLFSKAQAFRVKQEEESIK